MAWLVDTNVISELSKPRPNPRAFSFVMDRSIEELFISTVTLAELSFGLGTQLPESRRAPLQAWLSETIRPRFAGQILEVREQTMLIWRILLEQGRKANHTFSQPDLILAATAVEHDLVFATRNTRDFAELPLQLVNPWD